MNVFISQPMNGKTEDEIRYERTKLFQKFKDNHPDAALINSILPKEYYSTHSSVECLGESIKMLNNADMVYFASGYENARGCIIEKAVCMKYGIPYELEDNE